MAAQSGMMLTVPKAPVPVDLVDALSGSQITFQAHTRNLLNRPLVKCPPRRVATDEAKAKVRGHLEACINSLNSRSSRNIPNSINSISKLLRLATIIPDIRHDLSGQGKLGTLFCCDPQDQNELL